MLEILVFLLFIGMMGGFEKTDPPKSTWQENAKMGGCFLAVILALVCSIVGFIYLGAKLLSLL